MYEYLVSISKNSLNLSAIFFEHLKSSNDSELYNILENVTDLALDCIYACQDQELYLKAKFIFDATFPMDKEYNYEKYKELENELKCIFIFNKYDIKITLNDFRKIKQDPVSAKVLLITMSENLNKK